MSVLIFRRKVVLTLVASMFIATGVSAQPGRTILKRNLFWGSVVVNYKFNERWSLVNDCVFRFEVTDGDLFRSGARSGLQYKTSLGFQLTAGGCAFWHYPNPNGKQARPELRPWQEVGRKFEFGIHHTFIPRIRFEQRFFKEYDGAELADEFTFHTYRLRVRAEYFYALGDSGNQRWSVVLGDEIMFHRRDNGFTSLDQNRVWAGFGYKINPAFITQLTYLHVYQQRTSTLFDEFHVIRLTLQITLKKRG